MSLATSDELAAEVDRPDRRLGLHRRGTALRRLRLRCAGRRATSGARSTGSTTRDRVARVAAGFRSLGLGPGDRIVLMVRNIPEFHVLDTAAYFCGATPISIYNSSSPEQIQYLVNHSRAVIAVVEDEGFGGRWGEVRSELTNLRSLGVVRGAADFNYDDLLSHAPIDLESAATAIDPGTTRHGDLHVGHDRTTQGRDAHTSQHRVDRRESASFVRPRRPCGQAPHFLSTDGPHRGADDVALPGHVLRLRGRHLSRSLAHGGLLPRGPP